MSDILQVIYSFPPKQRSAISDREYDRQMREYVKVVERLPSEAFESGGMRTGKGVGGDLLEVCVFFSSPFEICS